MTADQIEPTLEFAIKSQAKFIFTISDDSFTHLHRWLTFDYNIYQQISEKFKLIERENEVIIQDMRMSKAGDVVNKNKHLTLENVINKTNVKLGGLNYSVVDAKKRLVEIHVFFKDLFF